MIYAGLITKNGVTLGLPGLSSNHLDKSVFGIVLQFPMPSHY